MPTRTRIIMVSILILLGGILFSYCVFCYPKENFEIPSLTYTRSDETGSALSGNAEEGESGQNKQTSSKSRSRYSGST